MLADAGCNIPFCPCHSFK